MPHGDHNDCIRSAQYVVQYLGGDLPAQEMQELAAVCRASTASCGLSELRLTRFDMDTLAAVLANDSTLEDHDDDHDDEHDEHEDGDDPCANFGEDSLNLRIASVFVILVAGAVGCVFSLSFAVRHAFYSIHPWR